MRDSIEMFLSPQQYFRLQGQRPRKRFGQHFLTSPGTAERIVDSADLDAEDVVVEVGPGLGALTRHILPKARRLHLVELDRDLAAYLGSSLESSESRVQIHQQDILDFDFERLARTEGRPLVVLGNLPYNISSPLVFRLLESMASVDRSVFMVQKEVGERLLAGPGSKDYGVLSVLLGIYAQTSHLFSVGPGQFYPPPQVDSLVVRVDFSKKVPADGPTFGFFRRFVSTAFQQRRKTLRNSLRGLVGAGDPSIEDLFAQSGLDPGKRPEAISPEDLFRLAGLFRLRTTSDVHSSS